MHVAPNMPLCCLSDQIIRQVAAPLWETFILLASCMRNFKLLEWPLVGSSFCNQTVLQVPNSAAVSESGKLKQAKPAHRTCSAACKQSRYKINAFNQSLPC